MSTPYDPEWDNEECTCVSYDKNTHEWGVAPECWGDCNEKECTHDWYDHPKQDGLYLCAHCKETQS